MTLDSADTAFHKFIFIWSLSQNTAEKYLTAMLFNGFSLSSKKSAMGLVRD